MSMAALRWARSVRGITGTQKLVLWALADMANDYGEAWPSALAMADDCCLSDRAVRDALDALEACGLIAGERAVGRATRWCIRLGKTPEPLAATTARPAGTPERRSALPASRSTPRHPGTSFLPTPEPASYPPRNVVPTTPERGSDRTLKNPHTTPNRTPKARGRAEFVVAVPEWIPTDAWGAWCQHRTGLKRSGWTEAAAVRCIATLRTLRDEGHDPRAVIDQSIAGGWTGLFALRGTAGPARAPSALSQWADLLTKPTTADLDGHAEEVFP
jgi:hypothetical protein